MTVTCQLIGWLCQQVFQRPKDQCQRRTELVTDIGEENGLGAVDFSQCLRPSALLLVGPRIGDAGCDLRRDQFKKSTVQLIEPETGADADDQKTCEIIGPARTYRNDNAAARRV